MSKRHDTPPGLGHVRRGPPGARRVALTFDDGPSARTDEIADVLAWHRARATFFVVGRRIPGREDALRRLAGDGHEIASHAFTHRQLTGRPVMTIYQIVRARRRIRAVAGSAAPLFRPPDGRFDAWVLRAARLARVTVVTWSVDSRDWSPGSTPAEVHDRVTGEIEAGDIVVLHDSGLAQAPAIAALPGILVTLEAQGYRAVTVSELLGLPREPLRASLHAPTEVAHNPAHTAGARAR